MALLLVANLAVAGPVPMFSGNTVPSFGGTPPVAPPSGPAIPGRFVGPGVVVGGGFIRDDPSLYAPTIDTAPSPTRPPPLRYVKAAPAKTRVAAPGKLTPISELPTAFVPLKPATNQLPPPVTIRPKAGK